MCTAARMRTCVHCFACWHAQRCGAPHLAILAAEGCQLVSRRIVRQPGDMDAVIVDGDSADISLVGIDQICC